MKQAEMAFNLESIRRGTGHSDQHQFLVSDPFRYKIQIRVVTGSLVSEIGDL